MAKFFPYFTNVTGKTNRPGRGTLSVPAKERIYLRRDGNLPGTLSWGFEATVHRHESPVHMVRHPST